MIIDTPRRRERLNRCETEWDYYDELGRQQAEDDLAEARAEWWADQDEGDLP